MVADLACGEIIDDGADVEEDARHDGDEAEAKHIQGGAGGEQQPAHEAVLAVVSDEGCGHALRHDSNGQRRQGGQDERIDGDQPIDETVWNGPLGEIGPKRSQTVNAGQSTQDGCRSAEEFESRKTFNLERPTLS